MPEKSIQELLKDFFSEGVSQDWTQAAALEIAGKDPQEALRWTSAENLSFRGYYDKTAINSIEYLRNFSLQPSSDPYSRARSWINLPQITVANEETAHRDALQHLNQGAEGVLFNLRSLAAPDFMLLLDKINWPFCHLSFKISEAGFSSLLEFIRKKQYTPRTLNGVLFWDDFPNSNIHHYINALLDQKNIFSVGLVIPTQEPIAEIAAALTQGAQRVHQLTALGIPAATAIRQIAFSLSASTDFLFTTAKLKALRLTWYQIAHAYAVTDYTFADLHIHVRSEPWIREKFEPHGNMLKGTSAAIAAILGGCNTLTILPEDENNTTMNRVARNISNLLREESHLDKVADPLAGAYILDVMIHSLAEAAWKQFQQQVAM